MAAGNGTKTRKPRATKPETVEAVALSPEDLATLRRRFELVQLQRQMLEATQESYSAFGRDLAARYDLPVRFNVDFTTGLVAAAE